MCAACTMLHAVALPGWRRERQAEKTASCPGSAGVGLHWEAAPAFKPCKLYQGGVTPAATQTPSLHWYHTACLAM